MFCGTLPIALYTNRYFSFGTLFVVLLALLRCSDPLLRCFLTLLACYYNLQTCEEIMPTQFLSMQERSLV
jgi:hypothetical protein